MKTSGTILQVMAWVVFIGGLMGTVASIVSRAGLAVAIRFTVGGCKGMMRVSK